MRSFLIVLAVVVAVFGQQGDCALGRNKNQIPTILANQVMGGGVGSALPMGGYGAPHHQEHYPMGYHQHEYYPTMGHHGHHGGHYGGHHVSHHAPHHVSHQAPHHGGGSSGAAAASASAAGGAASASASASGAQHAGHHEPVVHYEAPSHYEHHPVHHQHQPSHCVAPPCFGGLPMQQSVLVTQPQKARRNIFGRRKKNQQPQIMAAFPQQHYI